MNFIWGISGYFGGYFGLFKGISGYCRTLA